MEQREQALAILAERNKRICEASGQQAAIYLMTFGCQMNLSDAEVVAGLMSEAGYRLTEVLEEADLVVIHTCGVREGAETRVMGRIGNLKALKDIKPDLLIAVGGCMTQQQDVAEQIQKVHRHVNLIFGTHNLANFAELLVTSLSCKQPLIALLPEEQSIEEGLPRVRPASASAWLSIMFGCDNYCTYCIVPYLRGHERSRRPEAILEEAKQMIEQGIVEITLLGQNVNSYGKGKQDQDINIDFADLLQSIAKLPGLARLRFVTSHPRDITPKLIEVMAAHSNICRQLHLPVQAGSNTVLQRMNRGYTREYYLDLVTRLRDAMPNLSLTTDIIVSFPGESEADFAETLDLVKQVRFDNAFTFIYSPRPGTPAASYPEVVDPELTQRRMNDLLALQSSIAKELNEELIGQTLQVFVEGPSKSGENMLLGRTESHKVVNFIGLSENINTFQKVRIIAAASYHLTGELIS